MELPINHFEQPTTLRIRSLRIEVREGQNVKVHQHKRLDSAGDKGEMCTSKTGTVQFALILDEKNPHWEATVLCDNHLAYYPNDCYQIWR